MISGLSLSTPGLFVAGAVCAAIPILIHLLMRRRRKPIAFGAMRFLREAYKKQRRRLQVERWLLLAARVLALLLLGLTLARPTLGGNADTGPRTVYLVLDEGLASAVEIDGETELERSKRALLAALASLDPARGDRAALFAASSPPRAIVSEPSPDLQAIERLVRDAPAADSRTDLTGTLTLIGEARDAATESDDPRSTIVVGSAWRAGSVDPDTEPPSLGEGTSLLALAPSRDPVSNTAIVSVEPIRRVVPTASAGSSGAIRVTARRYGPATEGAELPIEVRTGEAAGSGQIRFGEGEREAVATVQLRLSGDGASDSGDRESRSIVIRAEAARDALHADDTRSAVVDLTDRIRVGVVGPRRFGRALAIDRMEPVDWVRLALAPESGAAVEPVDLGPGPIEQPRLAGLDAVVVAAPSGLNQADWSRLGALTRSGGLLVLMPDHAADAQPWVSRSPIAAGVYGEAAQALSLEPTSGLTVGQDTGGLLGLLAAELDPLLAPVRVTRAVRMATGDARPLLALADGAPWLTVAAPDEGGRGLVAAFASPLALEWTDLPAKPLVVPLLQELVRQGVGQARAARSGVAGFPAPRPAGAVELVSESNSSASDATPRTAGALVALDNRGASLGRVVVNPDTNASDTAVSARDAIESWLTPVSGRPPTWIEPGEADDATGLATGALAAPPAHPWDAWLAGALLALILVETFLARRASHAERATSAEGAEP
ncbi:MAG: BatA domain-containing protein [Planctomycetota bacterium]